MTNMSFEPEGTIVQLQTGLSLFGTEIEFILNV